MQNLKRATVFVLIAFGLSGMAWGYPDATKLVAFRALPQEQKTAPGPILLVPSDQMASGKRVVDFLRRAPQPTLSIERIRMEKLGPSRGTKEVVSFFQNGR